MTKDRSDIAIIILGRVVQVIITAFSLRIATQYLLPVELGQMYLVYVGQALFSLVVINPIGQYFTRHTISWHRSGYLINALQAVTLYIFAVSVSVAVLIGLFGKTISGGVFAGTSILMATLIFSQSVNQTILPSLNIIGRKIEFVSFGILTSGLSLLFSVALVEMIAPKATYWISGMVIGAMLSNVFAGMYFQNITSAKFDFVGGLRVLLKARLRVLKKIRLFSGNIALYAALFWFVTSGYRLILEDKLGLEGVALIGLGFALASQMFNALESILSQILQPKLLSDIEDFDEQIAYEKYFLISTSMHMFCTLSAISALPVIFSILIDASYNAALSVAYVGVAIEFFRVSTNVFLTAFIVHKNTKKMYWPNVIGAIIISGYVLLWPYEITVNGFLIALLLANAVICATTAYIVIQNLRVFFSWAVYFKAAVFSIPVILITYLTSSGDETVWNSLLKLMFIGPVFMLSLIIMLKVNRHDHY